MKTVIIFAFLIAGIIALPPSEDYSIEYASERIVTGSIVKAIEAASQSIRAAGLDPLYIEKKESTYALPVPVLFNTGLLVEELLFSGLSNIVVHRMNYAVVSSRLTFDIEMPLIHLSVGAASAHAILFGRKFDIKGSGTVHIRSIRVVGQVRVSVGILTGTSIRSININLTLGSIDAKVNLVVQGKDYSEKMNTFLNTTIPNTLKEYNAEVNELIEIIMLDVINANLKKL